MRLALAFALIAAVFAAAPDAAQAKSKNRSAAQYVIPFTCGENLTDVGRVLPGRYAISVDVRSPSSEASVDEQVILTYPPGGQLPGFASEVIAQTIPAGSAIQLGCDEILGASFLYQTPPPVTPYVQGLLILTSRASLQVFATRTAQGTTGGLSMETESVPPSSVPYVSLPAESKVTICHRPPGNPGNSHTISVGLAAWPAHQAHGDTQGECLDDDDDDDDDDDYYSYDRRGRGGDDDDDD
jgi:hypothetical protein